MRKLLTLTLVAVMMSALVVAQNVDDTLQKDTNNRGTVGFTFLKLPATARNIALGEVGFTGNLDASAIFTNVSELAEIGNTSLFYNSAELYDGLLKVNNFAVGAKVSERIALGAFVRSLTTDQIEITTMTQPDGTGQYYDFSDTDIGVAFAYRATKRFSIGAKVHAVSEKIGQSSASTVLIDVSTDYRISYANIRITTLFENFGADAKYAGNDLWATVDPTPPNDTSLPIDYTDLNRRYSLNTREFAPPTRIAIGVRGDVIGENAPVILEGNVVSLFTGMQKMNDQYESYSAALEYKYVGLKGYEFALRGSGKFFREEDYETVYAFGAGIRYVGSFGIGVDYAYKTHEDLEQTQYISLSMNF